MTVTMPDDVKYGKVVGRYIVALGDGVDADRLPDAIAAKGYIGFEPLNRIMKSVSPIPTTINKNPIDGMLDLNGDLIDFNGDLGVWLIVGDYRVFYNIEDAVIPSHKITVLETHTDESPLNLVVAFS